MSLGVSSSYIFRWGCLHLEINCFDVSIIVLKKSVFVLVCSDLLL